MNNGDKPAMALTIPMSDIAKLQAAACGFPQEPTIHEGLTKREHFASLFMAALIVPGSESYNEQVTAIRADLAVKHADALLKALEG